MGWKNLTKKERKFIEILLLTRKLEDYDDEDTDTLIEIQEKLSEHNEKKCNLLFKINNTERDISECMYKLRKIKKEIMWSKKVSITKKDITKILNKIIKESKKGKINITKLFNHIT